MGLAIPWVALCATAPSAWADVAPPPLPGLTDACSTLGVSLLSLTLAASGIFLVRAHWRPRQ